MVGIVPGGVNTQPLSELHDFVKLLIDKDATLAAVIELKQAAENSARQKAVADKASLEAAQRTTAASNLMVEAQSRFDAVKAGEAQLERELKDFAQRDTNLTLARDAFERERKTFDEERKAAFDEIHGKMVQHACNVDQHERDAAAHERMSADIESALDKREADLDAREEEIAARIEAFKKLAGI